MPKKKNFWNKEYKKATHLAMSETHSEDLEKFTRFLQRKSGKQFLNVTTRVLDAGCGNGRNSIFLAQNFGVHGYGFDSSTEAIREATQNAESLPLTFEIRSLTDPIPLKNNSVTIALDMMASHVLKKDEREAFREELLRVIKPGGWLFFKTFLLDGDRNAEVLLQEHPGPERGMYIHPEIGVAEYVWSEQDIIEFFEPYYTIHKIDRSHKHINKKGGAWKRRTASVYLEKN